MKPTLQEIVALAEKMTEARIRRAAEMDDQEGVFCFAGELCAFRAMREALAGDPYKLMVHAGLAAPPSEHAEMVH